MARKKQTVLSDWIRSQAEELDVLEMFDALSPNEYIPDYLKYFGGEYHTMAELLAALTREPRERFTDYLLSTAHSLVWRLARPLRSNHWTHREKIEPMCSRLELEQWANFHGISDLLDVPLMRLAAGTHIYLRNDQSQISWWCTGDVLSQSPFHQGVPGLAGYTSKSILSVLQAHSERRGEQKQKAARMLDALGKQGRSDDGVTALQIKALGALLDEYRRAGVAPYPGTYHTNFSFDPRDARASSESGYMHTCYSQRDKYPKAIIEFDRETPQLSCNCDVEHRHRHCTLKALALCQGISHLQQLRPESEALREFEQALDKSRFERLLGSFLDRLEKSARPIPETLDGVPCWLGWRIEGTIEDGLKARPALVRGKKRSGGVVSKIFTAFEDVSELFSQVEAPHEQLLLRQWEALEQNPYPQRQNTQRQQMALLAALAGHSRLYYHTTRTFKLEIVHHVGKIKLSAGDTPDAEALVQLVFGDVVLERYELPEVLDIIGHHGYLFENLRVDEEREHAVLKIWSLDRAVIRQLEQLERLLHMQLSSDARADLVSSAPRLVQNPNITLSESLRGVRTEAEEAQVIKLAIEATSLELSILAKPLSQSALYSPGQGPQIAYAITPEGIFNAERDMSAEAQRAKALADELDLIRDPQTMCGAHAWRFQLGDHVFDLLERIEAYTSSNPERQVEVIWDTSRFRLAGQIPSNSLTLEVNAAERYLNIGGRVTLEQGQGASVIPLAQLLEASRHGRRWVQLDDESWAKISDALRESIDRVGALLGVDDDGEVHAQVSPLAAPALMALAEDAAVKVTGPATWLELSDRVEAARRSTPEVPEGFEGELRSYQREGFQWLSRLSQWAPGACLADDMGLGKTVQAITLLLERAERGPALLIGPTSLGFNWQRECKRFAPSLRFQLVRASAQLEKLARPKSGELIYMSYDLAARNETWCKEQAWATLVLDEAQAIKNAATQRAKAIHGLDADFALALTGTPLENHTGELWSLMEIVAPGLLGSQGSFRRTYQIPIEQRGEKQARATLAALISPFVLRRAKSQVARDLPERTDIRLDIELSAKERQLYDELRKSALAEMEQKSSDEEQSNRFELLAVITRLRQIACHPKLYRPTLELSSSKLVALIEKLEEVRQEGHHALVFSQFTSLLELVDRELVSRGFRTSTLTGATPSGRRGELVDAFQRGEQDVFLLSIKAGGVGLNLTRASFVFVLDPWWNPAVEDQATDRAHRIGQNKPVTVYKLVALDTVEEVIYQMHETKRELLDAVMAGSGSARALSLRELEAMVAGDYSALELQAPEARQAAEEVEIFSLDTTSNSTEVEEEDASTGRDAPEKSAYIATLKGATQKDVDAAVDSYLRDAVTRGELTEGSARAYERRIKLLGAYARHLEKLPEDLAEDYKQAITRGDIKRTKTDMTLASTSAKHLIAMLQR